MNKTITKEIDLMDLFVDWLSHWKSLLVCIFIGLLMSGGYFLLMNYGMVHQISSDNLTSSTEGMPLSSLSTDQISKLSVDDMERQYLSAKDVKTVEEVLELNKEYKENFNEYESKKDSLEIADRTEAFNYLANSKNIVEARRASLTPDQQIYYYAKLGLSSEIGSAKEKRSNFDGVSVENPVSSEISKKKLVLIVLILIVFHFVIIGCKYLFSNKIKHVDKLSSLVDVPEYTRVVNWEKIDSTKGLDRIVNKIRYGKIRKVSMQDAVAITSSIVLEKMRNKKYNSIAVVGEGIVDDRSMLVEQIANNSDNIVAKSIDSITHNVLGADDITGVDAAIIAVHVGISMYEDFYEEIQALRDREIDVIGIVVFE